MNEADVSRLFDGVALPHEVKPVVEVCLTLRGDGSPRGYGFVELATSVQAERAKSMLDGRAVSYGGRMPTTLVVRDARAPNGARVPAPPVAGRVLWVGNLSFGTRPTSVRDVFADAGNVDALTVWCQLARGMHGRSSGFGTVRFPDVDSAAAALDVMIDAELDGRRLIVQYDTRTGPAVDGPTASQELPAADAIDPEVLAAVESSMLTTEMQSRRQAEVQRQSEIHRRYLMAVTAAERSQAQSKAARKARKAQGPAVGGQAGTSGSTRVLLSNLSYDGRAAAQRRTLVHAIGNSTALRNSRRELLTSGSNLSAVANASAPSEGGPAAGRRRRRRGSPPPEPVVWVGADKFGRSLGKGWVHATSRNEARELVALLNGTSMEERTLSARLEVPEPEPATGRGLLPQWRPLWLARATEDVGAPPPTVAEAEWARRVRSSSKPSTPESDTGTFTLDMATLKWTAVPAEADDGEAAVEDVTVVDLAAGGIMEDLDSLAGRLMAGADMLVGEEDIEAPAGTAAGANDAGTKADSVEEKPQGFRPFPRPKFLSTPARRPKPTPESYGKSW